MAGHNRSFLLLGLLVGCRSPEDTAAGPPSAILLVLDGVRTDEFTTTTASDITGVSGQSWAEETWKTVAPDATVVRAARNTGITITAPAHAALVTGRVETFANFPVDSERGPGLYRPTHPTFFEEARAQLDLPEDKVLLLANTELLEPVDTSLYPGLGDGAETDEVWDTELDRPAQEDAPVLDALLERIADDPPRLAVVNLHDVDRAGHYGHGDAYIDGVSAVDGLVAELWETIHQKHPGYAENLLLVVTADHGRHRHAEDQGWHNHGDSCTGCREVPLMVLGGGAEKGTIAEDLVAAIDLSAGIAGHLGIDLPWAQGLPSPTLFPTFEGSTRAGEIAIAADGAVEAWQAWVDDPEQRSEVYVGDTLVSTPGVFAAEGPTVYDAVDGARACFRELAIDEVDGTYPWVPRCLAHLDGTWTEMGFPDTEVAPFWKAAVTGRNGVTWAAWPFNPRAAGSAGTDGRIGLSVAGWSAETGWAPTATSAAIFPTDAAIVATDSGLVVASGASDNEEVGRYTRHVQVLPVALDGATPVFDGKVDFDLAALLGDDARVELPALSADGDTVRVAMVGITADGASIATSTSADGGYTWSDAELLPTGDGPALPYLAPLWDGDAVVWGALDGDEALVCRATPGDTAADCIAVGSPRLESFVLVPGGVRVVRDAGVGQWEIVSLDW